MRSYDRIIGWIWFAIGGGMAIEGVNLGLGKSHLPGIGFVPFLVGSALGVCGLIMAIMVTLKGKGIEEKIWEGLNWRNLVLPLLSLLVYALLLEHLGFIITTFFFQFILLKLTAPKRWLSPVLTSLVIVLCCHFVFSLWLKVPLPKGILGIG